MELPAFRRAGEDQVLAAAGGFLKAAEQIAESGTFSRFDHLPSVDALPGA